MSQRGAFVIARIDRLDEEVREQLCRFVDIVLRRRREIGFGEDNDRHGSAPLASTR